MTRAKKRSEHTAVDAKEGERQQLAADLAQFKRSGGVIQRLHWGDQSEPKYFSKGRGKIKTAIGARPMDSIFIKHRPDGPKMVIRDEEE